MTVKCLCARATHSPRLVVLTGGPGAGKTAVLEVVRRSFCEHVGVLPEAAGILFGGGFPRRDEPAARRATQRAIYRVQRELERIAVGERRSSVVLCDRGTLDGLAYWPGDPTSLWTNVGSTPDTELARYDAVIHLRTASSGDAAARVDEHILDAWALHPLRFVVDPAAHKVAEVLDHIRGLLPACCHPELGDDFASRQLIRSEPVPTAALDVSAGDGEPRSCWPTKLKTRFVPHLPLEIPMLVSQIMSRDVETCSPHDSLEAVARICWNHDVGVVPVVDGGYVVGLITDRDVCMAAYTRGCVLRDALVSSAMSTPVRACRPDADLSDAMRIMADAQVRRLVVTDAEGRLVGALSFSDLVREAARTGGRLAQDVIKALATVCAPRADALHTHMPATTDLVATPPTPIRAPALDRERSAKPIVAAAEVGAKP